GKAGAHQQSRYDLALARQTFLLRPLEGWRRVNPEYPGFCGAAIRPLVRHGAFEIEAIAPAELKVLIAQADLQFAFEYEEKFLAKGGVGFAAAGAGRDAERGRFHTRVAPGEQLHANAIPRLEHLAHFRANHGRVRFRRVVEIEDIVLVITRELAQRSHRSAHLRALERTEESDGDADLFGYAGERRAHFQSQLAQAGSDRSRRTVGMRALST